MGIGNMTLEDKQKICSKLGDIGVEIYDELVGDFKEQTLEQINQIRDLLSSDELDWAVISRLSHSIKGSSRNLRIPVLGDLAWTLEENAKETKDKSTYSSGLDDLEQKFKEFSEEYKAS